MTTIHRPSGLTLNVPGSFQVAETSDLQRRRRRATRRGAFRSGPAEGAAGATAELDVLIEAFEGQDMVFVDDFEIEARAPRRRRGPSAEPESASIDVELDAGEDAVILIEQDGLYSWQFADRTRTAEDRRPRGRRAAPAGKVATFRLDVTPEDRPPRRSAQRGFVRDFVFGKVRGVVFKFVAGRLIGGAVTFLERNVQKGPILISSENVDEWQRVDSLAGVARRQHGAPRILLLVHGTFSSTRGSFGALSAYPWGRSFLRGAMANYDVVLGFDHPTLSVTPYDNAVDILHALRSAGWEGSPAIDAIAFSRGGLVLRSLIEDLLPSSGWPGRVDRAVFVACTNAGTHLADPDNWHSLVNLYTNVAMAGARALGLVPQFAAAAQVAKEAIQGVSAVLKYMATEAVQNRAIPGLAAMDPDGAFVSAINELQPGQPSAAASNYFAITSEFEPSADSPPEFSARLKQRLADRVVDRLMGGPNDLVVDTASMTSIDLAYGNFIKGVHAFGTNPHVYHTVYFAQPETSRKITEWLRLIDPELIATARSEGVSRAAIDSARIAMDVAEVGAEAATVVTQTIDRDIRVLPAYMSAAEAAEAIRSDPPRYVVVRREWAGEQLDYAFDAGEVVERTRRCGRSTTLEDALDLHETGRSRRVRLGGGQEDAGGDRSRPTVVVDGGRRVGVIDHEGSKGTNAEELATLARGAGRRTVLNEIRGRVAMPRFETPTLGGGEDLAGASAGAEEAAGASPPRGRRTRGGAGARRRGGDGARRGGRAPARGRLRATAPEPEGAAPEGPSTMPCDFHAEMPGEAVVGKTTTVEVTVSRETIERIQSATSVTERAAVKKGQKIIVQLLARANCDTVDDGRAEIDPPQVGAPELLFFDLTPTHEGDGEVWVIARQGQVPLVKLVLKPVFVKKATGTRRRVGVDAVVQEAKPLAAPLHQLRIFDRRNGDQAFLEFDIESPELGLLAKFPGKPSLIPREKYVNDLYKQIEDFWAVDRDDYDSFMANLRALGAQMFTELVPEPLQKILWDNRDKLKSIQVISEEPFIPWELVHLKEPGKPLPLDGNKFLGEMGLVRWLYGNFPRDELDFRRGARLFVVPDYPVREYELPGAQDEKDVLVDLLDAQPFTPEESRAVYRLISEPGKFDILHFACHGLAETSEIYNAGLLMKGRIADGDYVKDLLTAPSVETYGNLKRDDGSGPLVFVNACQAGRTGYSLTGLGGFAKAFLEIKASAFIGTLWSIGDLSALTFAETFYKELMAGKTISETAIAARDAAKNAREVTWLAYVIYAHPHARVRK